MQAVEKSYSFIFKNLLRAVNPVKKRIMKTECKVHKFINNQSVIILKNDGRKEAYNLMSAYINDINAGVVWADQDLKSSNHFYNPHTDKGLYGNSDAKIESISYYTKALHEYFNGNIKNAMFYLGAACHLIQDLTVPQHANVNLLNNHRSYEKWVIKMYKHHDEFKAQEGGIYLHTLTHYIDYNSKNAIATYKRFMYLKDQNKRFYKITSIGLVMAQKTTAGFMFKFFKDLQKIEPIMIAKHKSQLDSIVKKAL
ncbi:MAG: phospholipase zinc-binding [Clostridia bacterium]|nr:phospholipase zinc-binding [Clostridia bacterium]